MGCDACTVVYVNVCIPREGEGAMVTAGVGPGKVWLRWAQGVSIGVVHVVKVCVY